MGLWASSFLCLYLAGVLCTCDFMYDAMCVHVHVRCVSPHIGELEARVCQLFFPNCGEEVRAEVLTTW